MQIRLQHINFHFFRVWEHRPQDKVGSDSDHDLRHIRYAHLHHVGLQHGYPAGTDLHLRVCQHLLLRLQTRQEKEGK